MTREEAIWLLEETKRYHLKAVCEAIDMAIEALQADAEDRLYIKIYADDEPSVKAEKLYQICGETQPKEVTEWLKEYFPGIAIEALSAETVQEWIPVSERLPDKDDTVLIFLNSEERTWHGEYRRIEFGMYSDDRDDHDGPGWMYLNESGTDYWADLFDDDVLAWMPLPEPYREVER